ncbi:hypothetical protein [Streptomyces sp. WAC 01325]|uniref:hypothetical protein n=1 Tax=Streptomyces sp. WAC 01325 TaxID=2203202 RepID=UPI000F8950B8|nr:hypothetical protein [Streptomyces sp. WAC 01325]
MRTETARLPVESAAYHKLLERAEEVTGAVHQATDLLNDSHPLLADTVRLIVKSAPDHDQPFGLLPYPVVESLGGNPDLALPLVTASRIWRAGAQVSDELAKGRYCAMVGGLLPGDAHVASTACLTTIPLVAFDRSFLAPRLRAEWVREITESSLDGAERRLADRVGQFGAASWKAAVYACMSRAGIAYARDAAMAARLADANDESVRGWRLFGRHLGVLRQLAAERAEALLVSDTDLISGANTALISHANEMAKDGREKSALLALRLRAQHDASSRAEMRQYLETPRIVNSFNQRISAIQRQLSGLLGDLIRPSSPKDLIHWMLDCSADDSRIPVRD